MGVVMATVLAHDKHRMLLEMQSLVSCTPWLMEIASNFHVGFKAFHKEPKCRELLAFMLAGNSAAFRMLYIWHGEKLPAFKIMKHLLKGTIPNILCMATDLIRKTEKMSKHSSAPQL